MNSKIFTLILVIFFSKTGANFASSNQSDECQLPLEVVFMIDSSDSVDPNVFDSIIFKAIEMIEKLKMEFSQIRVTILNYADKLDEVISFSPNVELIKNRLIAMSKLNGQGNSLLALEKTTTLLLRNDFDRFKMTIWLTDGHFNDEEYALIRQQCKILKSISHLFIVKSGNKINGNKLKLLLSTPKNLYSLNNINNFYRLISDVTTFECKKSSKSRSRILNKNRAIDWLLDLFG